MQERKPSPKHIVLTSHPSHFGPKPISIQWGEKDPMQRGPIVVTLTNPAHRNVIGTHSGSYAVALWQWLVALYNQITEQI